MSHEDIPFFAQIIALADTLDLNFDLGNACNTDSVSCKSDRLAVINFVNDHRNTYFSPLLSDVFVTIAGEPDFWEALSPGKLTEEEFEEIKIHPTVTRNCLKDMVRNASLSVFLDANEIFWLSRACSTSSFTLIESGKDASCSCTPIYSYNSLRLAGLIPITEA